LFSRQDNRTKVQVKENELDYMRMLHHPNIVQCLAIEADVSEVIHILQLCVVCIFSPEEFYIVQAFYYIVRNL
jgi:hypothetical protein